MNSFADSLGSQLVDICEKCNCPIYAYEGFIAQGTADRFTHLTCVVQLIKDQSEE